MQNLIDKALMLATKAHTGQTDKAGGDYITHPVYVASLVKTDEEKITALLHDVVEDSDITLEDLEQEGFPPSVVDAVKLLTKQTGTDYGSYIADIKSNPLSRAVKIADLQHNSDLSRLPKITEKDRQRAKKYKDAILYLS